MEQNQRISQTLAVLLQTFPGVFFADLDQVGQVINASKSACYLRSHRGENFPPVTKIGSRSLVKLTDLADWIDAQQPVKISIKQPQQLELKKKRGRPTKAAQIAAKQAAVDQGA